MKSPRHSRNGFLCSKGLEEAAQRELEISGVDATESSLYLDSRVSVSGLELERDLYEFIVDSDIDEQARRFHHGT